MVSAIIVAAGKGRRMHAGTRKQYLTVAGRTVLGHTLKKFDVCDDIDSIYLVVPEEDFDYCRENGLKPGGFPMRRCLGGAHDWFMKDLNVDYWKSLKPTS